MTALVVPSLIVWLSSGGMRCSLVGMDTIPKWLNCTAVPDRVGETLFIYSADGRCEIPLRWTGNRIHQGS